jgi:hypothetical protein
VAKARQRGQDERKPQQSGQPESFPSRDDHAANFYPSFLTLLLELEAVYGRGKVLRLDVVAPCWSRYQTNYSVSEMRLVYVRDLVEDDAQSGIEIEKIMLWVSHI